MSESLTGPAFFIALERMDQPVATATETTPADEAPVSLADHEAQFSPTRDREDDAPIEDEPVAAVEPVATSTQTAPAPTAEPQRPRVRHRAKSQQATPADVPRIAELTGKLRETEKLVAELRARLDAPPKVDPPAAFTDREPTIDDFKDAAEPYVALARAQAAFDRRKETFESQQKRYTDTQTATQAEVARRNDEFFNTKHQAHLTRVDAYLKANPAALTDFQTVTDGDQITSVMAAAVACLDDDSASALHALIRDRDLRDDLILQTEGKPLTPTLVAIVQRRIKSRMQAGGTGSVAPRQPVMVPRPPNPVRTMPQIPNDQPPAEGASLREHERYYAPRRRQG